MSLFFKQILVVGCSRCRLHWDLSRWTVFVFVAEQANELESLHTTSMLHWKLTILLVLPLHKWPTPAHDCFQTQQRPRWRWWCSKCSPCWAYLLLDKLSYIHNNNKSKPAAIFVAQSLWCGQCLCILTTVVCCAHLPIVSQHISLSTLSLCIHRRIWGKVMQSGEAETRWWEQKQKLQTTTETSRSLECANRSRWSKPIDLSDCTITYIQSGWVAALSLWIGAQKAGLDFRWDPMRGRSKELWHWLPSSIGLSLVEFCSYCCANMVCI